MAKTTFSGPVISVKWLYKNRHCVAISLTADTTLTVATHATRMIHCNMQVVHLLTKYACKQ